MKALTTILNLILAAAASAIEDHGTVDSGGSRSTHTAAAYVNDGCIGGISGTAGAGETTARIGYIGQLTEATGLSIAGSPASVSESATTQLSGSAVMDDDSVTLLTGSEIRWDPAEWPLSEISSGGLATAALVYADTTASINGSYLDVDGSGSILVEDTIADNFGSYAGDGLPDDWQSEYFDLDNPLAAPLLDPDGDGQNNAFECTAGLVPTDPLSRFSFSIAPVPGQPDQKQVIFDPIVAGRTYTVLTSPDLSPGSWDPLTGGSVSNNGDERTVTDTSATEARKFYRVDIEKP